MFVSSDNTTPMTRPEQSSTDPAVDELIIRFLQGRASAEEEERLRCWRRASFGSERRYREVARVWELATPAVGAESHVPPQAADLLRRRAGRGGAVRALVPRAAAAAAFIALGAAINAASTNERPTQAFGATELVTGPSELVTTRLADGSIVRLAPHSRLRVAGGGPDREVWLEGRAFFAVAHDGSRTFTVRTRAGDALVLGTRFELRVDDDDMQLVVLEGRVALEAGGERVEVNAGEISKAVDGASPSVVAVGDVTEMLDWMGPFLVFENTPLRSVAGEIEDRYGIRVEVAGGEVGDRTVTAWFSDQSVEEVLMVICRIADARCSISGSLATIRPH